MVDLQAVLSSVDKHSRGTEDSQVQHWLKKYKSVAYDIEDVLDELETDAMIWKNTPSKVHALTLTNPFSHVCVRKVCLTRNNS